MNSAVVCGGILACTCLASLPAPRNVAELDEHLRFLEPLMGRHWEGGFVGREAPDVVISLRFEPALGGKSVRYTREVTALGYASETQFYWNPTRAEVLYLELNSRGIVGEGVASLQDGAIVLSGVAHWPEGPYESRTVLELNDEGVLRDTFSRKEEGRWVPGHVQEFIAKDGSGTGGP